MKEINNFEILESDNNEIEKKNDFEILEFDNKENIDKVYSYNMIIFEYEKQIKKIYENNEWSETFFGYIIDLKDYEDLKKKIQYEKLKEYFNDEQLCKGKIKEIINSMDIQGIENSNIDRLKINDSKQLIQLLKNNKKYKIINEKLWKKICIKGKENRPPILYYIEFPELTLVLNKNDLITFFYNDNILKNELYITAGKNKLMNIANSIIEYYNLINKLENKKKNKDEKNEKGYLVSKTWIDNWKNYVDFSKFNEKSKSKIEEQISEIFKNSKRKRRPTVIETLYFKNPNDIEEYLKNDSLVIINESFLASVSNKKIQNEKIIKYCISDEIIKLNLKEGSIQIKPKDNNELMYTNIMFEIEKSSKEKKRKFSIFSWFIMDKNDNYPYQNLEEFDMDNYNNDNENNIENNNDNNNDNNKDNNNENNNVINNDNNNEENIENNNEENNENNNEKNNEKNNDNNNEENIENNNINNNENNNEENNDNNNEENKENNNINNNEKNNDNNNGNNNDNNNKNNDKDKNNVINNDNNNVIYNDNNNMNNNDKDSANNIADINSNSEEDTNLKEPQNIRDKFILECPHIGLTNIGATCYMNATLQCMNHIEKFVNYFKYEYIDNKVDNLSISFKILFDNLWPNDNNIQSSKDKYYAPEEFKNKISKMNPLFKGIAANDSKDLVNFIIMTLHAELNKPKKDEISNIDKAIDQRNKDLVLKCFLQDFNKNNNSIIKDLFYAVNCNITECKNCGNKIHNNQIYFFIIFPLEEVRKFRNEKNIINNNNNNNYNGNNNCQNYCNFMNYNYLVYPNNNIYINNNNYIDNNNYNNNYINNNNFNNNNFNNNNNYNNYYNNYYYNNNYFNNNNCNNNDFNNNNFNNNDFNNNNYNNYNFNNYNNNFNNFNNNNINNNNNYNNYNNNNNNNINNINNINNNNNVNNNTNNNIENNNIGENNVNNEVNIYDCFDYDKKINTMTGENSMYCNICKGNTTALMYTNLVSGPKILILILNRGKGIEFDVKIKFYEEINLFKYIEKKDTGYKYKLIGVITHIGESSMSGHFIAYCKDFINGKWYKYNDAIVTEVNDFQNEVINFGMPYLLFYQKEL